MLTNELPAFLLPPLLAGLIHHFVVIRHKILPALAIPISKNLFGNKKTWRGIITMTVLTAFFTPIIFGLFNIDIQDKILTGAVIGLFYSLGELPNSFLKRRSGIAESCRGTGKIGALFAVMDHFDSVIAASLSLFIFYNPTAKLIFSLIFCGATIHYLIDLVLRRKGYKKSAHTD